MTESAKPLPDLSIIMPCYNEQDTIGYTIPQLAAAFAKAGFNLELVAVDNGSADRTGEIIREMAAKDLPIVSVRVDVNQGYGFGVLTGIPHCRAPWVGIIPADGQVDAEDVVRLFDLLNNAKGDVLGKVRRRFRMDGLVRKVVSVAYNVTVFAFWPRLGSIDINGSPKILPRRIIERMDLQSKRWFLDPEIMVKAHYMGVRVLEMNVFARMRSNGLSHVRADTCWEFLRNLLRYRFTGELRRWRDGMTRPTPGDLRPTTDPSSSPHPRA